MADLEFGATKSLEELTLDDVLKYPIWLWDWEAGLEGDSEDAGQCPVLNSTNVLPDMREPIITLRVDGTNLFASASYNPQKDQLEAISLWQDGEWVIVQETSLPLPLRFVSVPTILGHANVQFLCTDPRSDRAARA